MDQIVTSWETGRNLILQYKVLRNEPKAYEDITLSVDKVASDTDTANAANAIRTVLAAHNQRSSATATFGLTNIFPDAIQCGQTSCSDKEITTHSVTFTAQ